LISNYSRILKMLFEDPEGTISSELLSLNIMVGKWQLVEEEMDQ